MIITYFGKQFFKIGQGELVLAVNPVSKKSASGISAHFGADIALVSANHADYNGVEQLSHGERSPFVINGPGDYEIREIFVKGLMSRTKIGGQNYINTIYSFLIDGINIVFLGALSQDGLPSMARESIKSPDLLFVPVGTETLEPKEAAKLVSTLEPKVIIPMDYDEKSLKQFLKEMGEERAETLEKLTIKRKDIENKEGEVIVLKVL